MDTLKKNQVSEIMYKIYEYMYRFEKKEERLFGISWNELYLLTIIYKGNKITVSQCSKKLEIPMFSTSRMITKLENNGLIQRINNEKDKRIVNIIVSPKGLDLIHKVDEFNLSMFENVFDKISSKDLNDMSRSIDDLEVLFQNNFED
ncbi:hypothetical protein SH2C18_37350 [Clostridium sediminicola]|uniref:MarR family winged helix-turn-helix transcriptional regulator n=1 Tax=Clostridium sediminicola TaxID=3114879 RepID=UPI0031F27739